MNKKITLRILQWVLLIGVPIGLFLLMRHYFGFGSFIASWWGGKLLIKIFTSKLLWKGLAVSAAAIGAYSLKKRPKKEEEKDIIVVNRGENIKNSDYSEFHKKPQPMAGA